MTLGEFRKKLSRFPPNGLIDFEPNHKHEQINVDWWPIDDGKLLIVVKVNSKEVFKATMNSL